MNSVIFSVLTLAVISGCGLIKNKESGSSRTSAKSIALPDDYSGIEFRLNDPDSKPFLLLSDFKVETQDAVKLSKEDLEKELKDSLQRRKKSDSNADTDSEAQSCFDNLFQNSRAEVRGDRLKVEIHGDFAKCFNKAASKDPDKPQMFMMLSANYRLYMDVHCEGADFSSLQGKSPFIKDGDSFRMNGCDETKKSTVLMNVKFDYDMELYVFGKLRSTGSTLYSRQKADGSGCDFNLSGEVGKTSECLELTKKTIDGRLKNILKEGSLKLDNKQIFRKYEIPAGAVATTSGSNRFSSGNVKFVINEWQGSVNFNGNTTPEWSALNSDNDKTQGKLEEK